MYDLILKKSLMKCIGSYITKSIGSVIIDKDNGRKCIYICTIVDTLDQFCSVCETGSEFPLKGIDSL